MKRITFVLLTYAVCIAVPGVPYTMSKYEQYKSDDRLQRTGSRLCYEDGSEFNMKDLDQPLTHMATKFCK